MMRHGWAIVLSAVLLSACAPKFSQPEVNNLGYLPITNDADLVVSVNQSVDTNEYRKLLYVQANMHGTMDWFTYQDYLMAAFREFGFFKEVVTREPTTYINTTPPRATIDYGENSLPLGPLVGDQRKIWFDMQDPVPYKALYQQYGHDFMIARATLRNKSGDVDDLNGYYFNLELIEGRSGKVLFQASKEGVAVLGIDKAVINPVLNYARGYLLYYDSTFVPKHPPTRSLADWVENFYYVPAPVWE